MTENERELLSLIRENENPEQALITAVLIISRVLKQCGSYPVPSADSQLGHA